MAKRSAPKLIYPTCVRHARTRKDVRLRHFFLCDKCCQRWVDEAFDGNDALWMSQRLKGYCQLCNKEGNVRLRTWFLCDICTRVAGSIGRNHVAEQAIIDFWQQHIEAIHPRLQIVQNDKSALRPRRDTDVSGEGPLDFLIRDTRSGKVLLGIENKTGRSSLRDMSEFQLDVSDCDSLLHHVRALRVPTYIIHAQVLEIWKPPTFGYRVEGLWWTDIYALTENFKSIRMRRDEGRGAAYFKKSAFKPIDTFREAVFSSSGSLSLVKRFKRDGIPQLYCIE